jgi:anti-sigma-K factor RskA
MTTDPHDLSGAYAIGAVDDDEAAAFEHHLGECSGCRDEVRELREALVLMADRSAVRPPAELQQLIMSRVRATGQDPAAPARDVAVPRQRTARSGRSASAVRVAWAVAVVLGLFTAGTSAIAWNQYQDAQAAHRLAAVVADPAAQRVTGEARGGGSVLLAVTADRAVVVTSEFPALPGGRTYQLWLERPGVVSSLGLGPQGASAAGSWSRAVEGLQPGDLVAISVEPAGGSSRPSTTPVVILRT